MSNQSALSAQTLVELLHRQSDRYGDKVAFRFCPDGGDEIDRLTYAELDRQARGIAVQLHAQGATGQRVLLVASNDLRTLASFFGCIYAGAVVVPVDDAVRLEQIAGHAEPAFTIVAAEMRDKVEATVKTAVKDRQVTCLLMDDLVAAADARADGWTAPAIDADTIAMLEYSSGTTGTPKGVLVSHGNVLANVEAQRQVWPAGDENAVFLSWASMHRNVGLINAVAAILRGGSTIVALARNFFPRPMLWLEAISRHRVTITIAFSSMYRMCVTKSTPEERAALDLSCLTAAIAGGEPLSPDDAEAFIDCFAPAGLRPEVLAPSYGLAQATLTVTGGSDAPAPIAECLERAALRQNRVVDAAPDDPFGVEVLTCGRPMPGVRVLVVDPETHRECGADQIGEVWVAGPNVTQGYWRRPDETEKAFWARLADTGDGPFLRTGDLGFFRYGELFLTGRWSDLVTVDNGHHYPGDIEATVQDCHPAFIRGRGAAFTTKPERNADGQLVIVQEVSAAVQSGQDDFAAAMDAVRAAVAERHDIAVHDVVLVAESSVPVTSNGKVQRDQCRRLFTAGKFSALAEWHAAPPRRPAAKNAPRAGQDPLTGLVGRMVERLMTGNRTKGHSGKSKFKFLYPYTTRQLGAADVVFLNYGYEEDPPLNLPLSEGDEPNRLGIQLYHQIAAQADLAGKDVLEVSCGHGGGASYLTRTFAPASYVGMDFNAAGIEFCRNRHRLPGLEFVLGDAQKLPFPDESFDAVVNVEASHGYPDFDGFLHEVNRVLRPGGSFLYADLRRHDEIPGWEQTLAAAPLRMVSERVINEETARGLRLNSPRLTELIDGRIAPKWQHFYREFAAVEGTKNFKNLETGTTSYRMYAFIKD